MTVKAIAAMPELPLTATTKVAMPVLPLKDEVGAAVLKPPLTPVAVYVRSDAKLLPTFERTNWLRYSVLTLFFL